MKVSVVIPTMLREELFDAIRSVRAQDYATGELEIVVVADKDRTDLKDETAKQIHHVEKLVFTGGGAGAPAARNIGVRHSTGEWVAFLDDDDFWTPSKISEQITAALSFSHLYSDIVVSSRVQQSKGIGQPNSAPVPTRCFQDGDPVERYLFERRTPSLGRSSMFTSTLFVNKELAVSNPWNESLKRHQDWDWLIRAQRAGAHMHQLDSVLSIQQVGSSGSISASTDWRSSLDWARSWKQSWAPQTYVDFVAGQPLRYALQGRSLRGVRQCLREILEEKRLPSAGPVMIGAAGLMSRAQLERFLVSSQPARRS